MTTFQIDNNQVVVFLENNETYTPATGTVQKLNLKALKNSQMRIKVGGATDREILAAAEETDLIADDTVQFTTFGDAGVITGFVLN